MHSIPPPQFILFIVFYALFFLHPMYELFTYYCVLQFKIKEIIILKEEVNLLNVLECK